MPATTPLFSFPPPSLTRFPGVVSALATIVLLLSGPSVASAADRTWLNPASPTALWETVGNWSGGSVPGVVASDNDNALITANLGGNQTITLGADRSLNSLMIGDRRHHFLPTPLPRELSR